MADTFYLKHMRFVKKARKENMRSRQASRRLQRSLAIGDVKLTEDREWVQHDIGLRPCFSIDDLKKFNGTIPPSWKLGAGCDLQKARDYWTGLDLQVKTIEDAIDALYVIENVW
eukprot:7811452-Alexandrium_andersonii.AAC.1